METGERCPRLYDRSQRIHRKLQANLSPTNYFKSFRTLYFHEHSTPLLSVVLDYVGACLDKGGQIDMLYADMSKAFDRINHKRLMLKLANSGVGGVGGNLLQWFQSYLTDRRQRVTVLGVTSKPLPVFSGVPQGSILGPALFRLYVNDLLEAPTSSRAAMFANIKGTLRGGLKILIVCLHS